MSELEGDIVQVSGSELRANVVESERREVGGEVGARLGSEAKEEETCAAADVEDAPRGAGEGEDAVDGAVEPVAHVFRRDGESGVAADPAGGVEGGIARGDLGIRRVVDVRIGLVPDSEPVVL